jgi:hypothetical protein
MNMEIPGPTAISCAKEPVSDDLLSNAAKTTIAEQKHTVHPVKSAIPIWSVLTTSSGLNLLRDTVRVRRSMNGWYQEQVAKSGQLYSMPAPVLCESCHGGAPEKYNPRNVPGCYHRNLTDNNVNLKNFWFEGENIDVYSTNKSSGQGLSYLWPIVTKQNETIQLPNKLSVCPSVRKNPSKSESESFSESESSPRIALPPRRHSLTVRVLIPLWEQVSEKAGFLP